MRVFDSVQTDELVSVETFLAWVAQQAGLAGGELCWHPHINMGGPFQKQRRV